MEEEEQDVWRKGWGEMGEKGALGGQLHSPSEEVVAGEVVVAAVVQG